MERIWAIPVIFGIALMLGFTPIQSYAENPACNYILGLVEAGKISPQTGANLLEDLNCVFVEVVIRDADNAPVQGEHCRIFDTRTFEILGEGDSDIDGMITATIPSDTILIHVFCTATAHCNIIVTEPVTEVSLVFGTIVCIG